MIGAVPRTIEELAGSTGGPAPAVGRLTSCCWEKHAATHAQVSGRNEMRRMVGGVDTDSTRPVPWLASDPRKLGEKRLQVACLPGQQVTTGSSRGNLRSSRAGLPAPSGPIGIDQDRLLWLEWDHRFFMAQRRRVRCWLGAKDRLFFEPVEDLVSDWSHVGF
jgi:hypothetical protein